MNVFLSSALHTGKIILLSVWNWWLQKLPNLPCLINFPPIANLWTFIPDPFLDSFNTLQPTPGVFSRPGKPLKTRSLQQKPCSKKISVFLRLISPHPLSTPMIHGLHSRRGDTSVNQMSVCADLRLEYLQNMISVWNICHVFADLSQTERSLSWPFKGSYLKHSLKRTDGHACPNIMRTKHVRLFLESRVWQ